MAWDVHIHVAFEVGVPDRLQRLAKRWLRTGFDDAAPPEAAQFLEHIANGGGIGTGRKGSLCTWGCVANYTSGALFIEVLRHFWCDLYAESLDDTGEMVAVLDQSARIVVFTEDEQSNSPKAFQVGFDKEARDVVVKVFEGLPFSWGQA